ncbi:MAG: 6-pyruvoyl tetrahydropterin synthase family protein [Planctomycetes bacterium]|nr:6-pyruvoyl tetrahydropterin synthase family protein [Planctomycetota bacterium]
MSESYSVRVTKDYLVFSAAHFITFGDDICERLHGHNYRVTAEVVGPLNHQHYVVDFILLRDTLQKLCLELDHYVLLPTQHPRIRVAPNDQEVVATFDERRWVFPRGDCVLLPVPNTTAELLARHLAGRLVAELQRAKDVRLTSVSVEVDECNGQAGRFVQTFPA